MLLRLNQNEHSDSAPAPVQAAVALVVKAVARDGVRRNAPSKAAKVARVQRMIEAEAWTDAVLALIELELPQWKLHRLVYDSGEWFCSLSQHTDLPAELGETVDGHHEVPTVAILQAFFEARDRTGAKHKDGSPSAPQIRPQCTSPICCDNFG
jgi:hypothetical protein